MNKAFFVKNSDIDTVLPKGFDDEKDYLGCLFMSKSVQEQNLLQESFALFCLQDFVAQHINMLIHHLIKSWFTIIRINRIDLLFLSTSRSKYSSGK